MSWKNKGLCFPVNEYGNEELFSAEDVFPAMFVYQRVQLVDLYS